MLTKGNPAYTVVQVASNDIYYIICICTDCEISLLGVSNVSVPFQTLFMSVVLFVVIPLAAGIITRLLVVRKERYGILWADFLHKFDSATTVDFCSHWCWLYVSGRGGAGQSTAHYIDCSSLIIQTFFIFFLAFGCAELSDFRMILQPRPRND